jgi:hypothetical protein
MSTAASAMSETAEGVRAASSSAKSAESAESAGSGATSVSRRYKSAPPIPSTMLWCTLEISAQRSLASPSTTRYSHSG